MSRRRGIARGAFLLLAALIHPAMASAQGSDCAVLRALTSHDPAELRRLRLSYEPGVGIAFWVGRSRSALAPATECDLNAESQYPGFSCRWHFRSYAEAAAFYDPLLAQARRCLGVRFTPGSTQNVASPWMVMRSSDASISRGGSEDDEHEIEMSIELIESTHPDYVVYYVKLGVDR